MNSDTAVPVLVQSSAGECSECLNGYNRMYLQRIFINCIFIVVTLCLAVHALASGNLAEEGLVFSLPIVLYLFTRMDFWWVAVIALSESQLTFPFLPPPPFWSKIFQ